MQQTGGAVDPAPEIGHVRAVGPTSVSGRVADPTPLDRLDDAALVTAARGGDRRAFGTLYERYARMVHGILLGRVPSADADDLTQDCFLQAMRRLTSLRDASAFGPWLAAIARNRASDFHRRSIRAEPIDEAAVECRSDATRVDSAGHLAQALRALEAIRSLPEAYRETLVLRLVEGMTGPEIARRTGMTEGSVRVNLHRGMRRLREKLGGLEGATEMGP